MLLSQYIEPKDLAQKLREGVEKILIVDVRDDDFECAKIMGSINVPYCNFNSSLSTLAKLSNDYDKIVFHCHFSARRGPSAAETFKSSGLNEKIEVLVLRGGFEKWHRLYNRDHDLYELIQ